MKNEVLSFLEEQINQKKIPGATIKVTHENKSLMEEAIGYRIYTEEEKKEMKLNTVFDLASLTKVIATLPSILKLIDNDVISLNDTIDKFIPDLTNKDNITITHLLTHTSGLPSHRKYYGNNLTRNEIFNSIYEESLEYLPGSEVLYSDLGFILLSKIVEEVVKQKLNKFVTKEIFTPLEMNETSYLPKFSDERYAATEYDKKTKTYKMGIVHDENAEAMGGISGHAGLFSTVKDLGHFTSMIENEGIYKKKKILSPEIINLSRQNFTANKNKYRGLAWQLKTNSTTSCGNLFSEAAYGHTGFTGTSIWFDPTVNLNVIFLTNRVHFGRKTEIQQIRKELHDLIRKQI